MLLWRLISGGNIFLFHSQHKTFAQIIKHLVIQSLLKPKILPTLMAILLELVCVTYGGKENECMKAHELMQFPHPPLHSHPKSEMPIASCMKTSHTVFSLLGVGTKLELSSH